MKLPPLSNLGNFFPKIRSHEDHKPESRRPFRVAQIEITSRCSTGCVFCPHDALSKTWVEGDMSLAMYREHIAPYLDQFELVYLQGWGEPMLHPALWDMLHLAGGKGCRTGFTTNGANLREEQSRLLLELEVNLISVSFAGTDASVHESLRTKSEFALLCHNFEGLAKLKQQNAVENLWLEVHFLMTRANLGELPDLVELAASLGADEVVATNLTYSPSLALDCMHVFGERALPEDGEVIQRAQQNAARLEIPLRIYPLEPEPQTLVCDADPLNTIYINHKGELSPCVYLGLTVQGQIPRYYQGEAHPFDTISFGNITDGLTKTLYGEERKSFVSSFKRRNISMNPLAMFSVMTGPEGEEDLTLPPVPCRHCYKMLGV